MSVDKEKKFVMKHTFIDVLNMKENTSQHMNIETNFTIPWEIFIYKQFGSFVNMFLLCAKWNGKNWSIDASIKTKVLTKKGEKCFETKRVFSGTDRYSPHNVTNFQFSNSHLIDGNLTVECHVAINKMTGIEKFFINKFDDDTAKEFSDVVLVVKDQKFYVNKMYLARHSSYFKSLLFGNFEESKQSKIELKDIDPENFQNFLEVLYGEPDIDDKTVDGILKLADMYDAKAAIRQCEKYLVRDSKKNLKEMFLLANQYKLDGLKKKCMAEFRTFDDIDAVLPENSSQFDYDVWKDLLKLSIQFSKKLVSK